jgi:hypothetical protein
VGVVDLDAVVQPVRVPVVHVDQEVRLITNPHLKPLAQQLEKEIVVLIQTRPEVAEINSNLLLHSGKRGAEEKVGSWTGRQPAGIQGLTVLVREPLLKFA